MSLIARLDRCQVDTVLLRCLIFSSLLLSSHLLQAGTFHVPADFQSIQAAISAVSAQGDTVVVDTGRYVENIDYHGKNIFLTSRFYLDSNDATIEQTIIDGGQNGSVVTFQEGETREACLNGFTITNGSGQESGDNTKGGGIFIEDSGPSLTNCVITNNHCAGISGGGGIFAVDALVYMSNLTVTRNSAQNTGGGIWTSCSDIEMDSVNRCSVFLNDAGGFCDIFQFHADQTPSPVYLDTATVSYRSEYFIGGNTEFDVNILNGKLEPVHHDLWVSPTGDDRNTGATPDDPLQTIAWAFHQIEADSTNPLVVHLLPGVFVPSDGQSFPINLRSWVSLIGSGRDTTILDLENTGARALTGLNMEKDYCIRSMTIRNATRIEYMTCASFSQNSGLIIEDILFSSNSVAEVIGYQQYEWMPYIDNTSIIIRNCDFTDNHCLYAAEVGVHKKALVQNCRFDNTSPYDDATPELFGYASTLRMSGRSHYYPYQYSHRVEHCVLTNNVNFYTNSSSSSSPALNVRQYLYPLDIVNCTFADNASLISGGIKIYGSVANMKVRMANCLIWNNELYSIYIDGEIPPPELPTQLVLSHSLVQDMEDGTNQTGHSEIIFTAGNFSADPLFIGEGETPYALTAGSPAIDAGVALWIVDGDTVVNLAPDQYFGTAPDIGAYEWDPDIVLTDDLAQLPEGFAITSIYPNPFNNRTLVKYYLPRACQVKLNLFTTTGRLVTTLIDAWVGVGEHSIQFSADGFASGVYVVQLQSNLGVDRQLMTLVK